MSEGDGDLDEWGRKGGDLEDLGGKVVEEEPNRNKDFGIKI